MKLLDLTIYYHEKSGGIKKYIDKKINFLKDIDNIDHTVIIPGKKEKTWEKYNSKIYELSSLPIPASGGYRFFRNVKKINQIINEIKPDIIEFGGCYSLVPIVKKDVSLISIFYHSDLINDISLYPAPKQLKDLFVSYIFEKVFAKSDIIITPSQKYQQTLSTSNLSNIICIPLGVDTNTFNPNKRKDNFWEKFNISKNKTKLLYVGRLSVDKNIKMLLNTLNYLDRKKFHLIIVGSGPLTPWIKLKERKIENLTYLGHIKEETVLANIYANADIFISASQYETFALTFLEAQSSGIPVVGFNLDLDTQLRKDFLAENFCEKSLAQKIKDVSQDLSNNLRNELHLEVKKYFSWEKTFTKLINLYRDLIRQKNFFKTFAKYKSQKNIYDPKDPFLFLFRKMRMDPLYEPTKRHYAKIF